MTMAKRKVARGEGETRKKILEVATRHFAEASYDEVALRTIAADVGVDVSYVHHSFGSKENLFRDVLDASGPGIVCSEMSKAQLVSLLANRLRHRLKDDRPPQDGPLLILVHSLTSNSVRSIVRNHMERALIEPVRAKLGDDYQLSAAVIVSLLTGFSVLHNLLRLPGTAEHDGDETEAHIATILSHIIGV